MNIVTTTSVYPPCTELLRATQTLRGIGFGGADIAFDYCVQESDFPFMTDAYADWASALRRMADDIGLIFSHGHAPFDASCRTDLVRRTLHCCQILGIRYLVVHPIWRDSEGSILHQGGFSNSRSSQTVTAWRASPRSVLITAVHHRLNNSH